MIETSSCVDSNMVDAASWRQNSPRVDEVHRVHPCVQCGTTSGWPATPVIMLGQTHRRKCRLFGKMLKELSGALDYWPESRSSAPVKASTQHSVAGVAFDRLAFATTPPCVDLGRLGAIVLRHDRIGPRRLRVHVLERHLPSRASHKVVGDHGFPGGLRRREHHRPVFDGVVRYAGEGARVCVCGLLTGTRSLAIAT